MKLGTMSPILVNVGSAVGDQLADQLEQLGFLVTRFYPVWKHKHEEPSSLDSDQQQSDMPLRVELPYDGLIFQNTDRFLKEASYQPSCEEVVGLWKKWRRCLHCHPVDK